MLQYSSDKKQTPYVHSFTNINRFKKQILTCTLYRKLAVKRSLMTTDLQPISSMCTSPLKD